MYIHIYRYTYIYMCVYTYFDAHKYMYDILTLFFTCVYRPQKWRFEKGLVGFRFWTRPSHLRG